MKKILSIILMFSPIAFSETIKFVDPLTYDHSDYQYEAVVSYINHHNEQKYCVDKDISCHPNILELAKAESLNAFLALNNASNKDYLKRIIVENCSSTDEPCSYDGLLKLYEENLWCDVGLGTMRAIQNSNYKNIKYE